MFKRLFKLIKCKLGCHDYAIAFSYHTGAYEAYCVICGKVLERREGRK